VLLRLVIAALPPQGAEERASSVEHATAEPVADAFESVEERVIDHVVNSRPDAIQ
jgi:hypothetical protein